MSKRYGMTRLGLITAMAVAGGACASRPQTMEPPQQAQLIQAITPPQRLEPPQHLSSTARALLGNRMAAHARDMGDLMSAIMILDYDQVEQRAGKIADDAAWARPLTGDATELNSALPETFFQLQDDLRAQARLLAAAADDLSAFAVAESYGRLSETCVRCHAVYRKGN